MDPETAITETSVVDLANVHAIRRGKRGMERIPIFRTDRVDKAAFGKSRRLMSSCIKH